MYTERQQQHRTKMHHQHHALHHPVFTSLIIYSTAVDCLDRQDKRRANTSTNTMVTTHNNNNSNSTITHLSRILPAALLPLPTRIPGRGSPRCLRSSSLSTFLPCKDCFSEGCILGHQYQVLHGQESPPAGTRKRRAGMGGARAVRASQPTP